MAQTVVRHALGSYPVVVAPGLVKRLGPLVRRYAPHRQPVVITDRTVARLVATPAEWPRLVVRPGEASKNRREWAVLTDRLLARGLGRDSVILAVGGGVIGDLAGFVAATYLRGVPFISVPTTLLAMVDASVGGKTGVNTRRGKNLVGVFHPPSAVLIDPGVLASLPEARYREGLVEAVKHGLIADPQYLRWILRRRRDLVARHQPAITRLVEWSVAIKGAIVAGDERERGCRAVLNAGHTVGHGLEQAAGYTISHGDAVALGLVAEAMLTVRLGGHPARSPTDLLALFRSLGLPLRWPPVSEARIVAAMRHDKKTAGGQLHFVSIHAGKPLSRRRHGWTVPASWLHVRQALRAARRLLSR